jgi:hypothetical protein
MQLFAILSLAVLVAVKGAYFSIVGEKCEVLSNSTVMFDSLLACGIYAVDPVVKLVCMSEQEINAEMSKVPSWTLVPDKDLGDSIKRTFSFSDFQNAFYFMTLSAQVMFGASVVRARDVKMSG